MKKTFLAVCLVLLIAAASFAASPVYTLLNAVTATGPGAGQLLYKPMNWLRCTTSWAGTAPTSVTVAIESSDLNASGSYYPDATVTPTVSPYTFYINKGPINYVRANYISKVAGDSTTAVTVTCTATGY